MSARVLFLALTLSACAQSTTSNRSETASPVAAENDEAGRKALGQLEDQWARALEAHDTAFFARVIAPDFHGTQDSAQTFGRADVMKDAADTTVQLRDLRDEDRQIRIYGDGTVGVVTGRSIWAQERGMRPGQYSGRYTEVWVRQNGQWQVVAGHYSFVPPSTSQ